MEHKTVNVIGGTVHYWISKTQEGINTTAIVLTHGLTADHTMFEKQVEYFKKDYTFITWIMRVRSMMRLKAC